jgi:TRAP-type C4-dicarboxylate transport system permease small subunit
MASGSRKFDDVFLGAIRVTAALLLVTMFIVIIFEVIARHALTRPAFWTEELARYIMFYMVLIGSAVATRQEQHPALTFIIKKFSARFRRVWTFIIDSLIFCVLIVILIEGYEMAAEEWMGKTPALRIPFFCVYLALPVGAFLMMVQIVAKCVFGRKASESGED